MNVYMYYVCMCLYLCMYVLYAYISVVLNMKSYWNPVLFLLQNNSLQKIPFTYIHLANYL